MKEQEVVEKVESVNESEAASGGNVAVNDNGAATFVVATETATDATDVVKKTEGEQQEDNKEELELKEFEELERNGTTDAVAAAVVEKEEEAVADQISNEDTGCNGKGEENGDGVDELEQFEELERSLQGANLASPETEVGRIMAAIAEADKDEETVAASPGALSNLGDDRDLLVASTEMVDGDKLDGVEHNSHAIDDFQSEPIQESANGDISVDDPHPSPPPPPKVKSPASTGIPLPTSVKRQQQQQQQKRGGIPVPTSMSTSMRQDSTSPPPPPSIPKSKKSVSRLPTLSPTSPTGVATPKNSTPSSKIPTPRSVSSVASAKKEVKSGIPARIR